MRDYDKNKKSSYIKYRDVNKIYRWATSQNLPVNNFEWIEDTFQFNEDFLQNCLKELPFLPEKMRIDKVETLVTNFHDKTEYVIHTRN